MKINPSKRIAGLPQYVFGVINELKKEAYEKKLDVIDLGMGNPDLPTPAHIVERLCDTVKYHPNTHRYPQAKGMPKFRRAISDFYKQRFNIDINPENEALVLIGSKEGIAHMCMSYLNPGDIALTTNPAYPVHWNGIYLADGIPYFMPINESNNYLPEYTKIPEDIARRAKLLFINYPNNPTTATVDNLDFFKETVKFAKKYEIIVCHDTAYSELCFDGYVAPSFLEVEGARDIGVEFNSLSKTYNMAGWRLGFVVGNAEIIKNLEKFKSYLDYGVFTPLQLAGVAALNGPDDCIRNAVNIYKERRDKFTKELHKLGWEVPIPRATMYLWTRLPKGFDHMKSLDFAELLIRETGIAVAPGIGFGEYGEGYIRMALVTHTDRFHDAILRLRKFLKPSQSSPNK